MTTVASYEPRRARAPRASSVSVAFTLVCASALGCGEPFEAGDSGDASADQSSPPQQARDATVDSAPLDADSVAPRPSDWAQWPMPNSPIDVQLGAPNLESYVDNGNGTVTDTVTGLMWQMTSYGDAGPFPLIAWAIDAGLTTAETFCADLRLAGYEDWRLPTLIELVSLVDNTAMNPAIDLTYFPGTPNEPFWSSTIPPGEPGNAWAVSFDFGYTGYGDESALAHVRCARGGS